MYTRTSLLENIWKLKDYDERQSFIISQRHNISLLIAKLLTLVIPILFIQSFPESLIIDLREFYLIIVMGICLFIALSFITLAPRYIPAYEVEIFFVLETILGPLWVWLIIHEQPTTKTLIGGICIILIIMSHALYELRSPDSNNN